MVAIPIAFDQPGVAARIAHHGVGELIEIGNLTAPRLSKLIAKIKGDPSYRNKATWFQKILEETRGLEVAADIIEHAFEDNFEDNSAGNRPRILLSDALQSGITRNAKGPSLANRTLGALVYRTARARKRQEVETLPGALRWEP